MTDRQFVLEHYPNAVLNYIAKPINTMRPKTYYLIRNGLTGCILGKGRTRVNAWKSAKVFLKKRIIFSKLNRN